jgi:hypothetical protein
MTDTKWTPGPWEVRKTKFGIGGDINHAGYCIAEVFGRVDYDCYPPAEATAHLIAAAPELAAAGQLVLDLLENMTTEEFALGEDRKGREQLRAALAKARGES